MLNNQKKCTKCLVVKDLSLFRFRNQKPISHCYECEKKYWENRKEITKANKKIYHEKNKSHKSEYSRLKRIEKRNKSLINSNFDMSILDTFVDIIGYEGIYKINKNGDVLSLPSKNRYTYEYKTQCDDGKGYARVSLWKDGKGKHFFVHRLVAIAFIPNTHNKPHINHIDGVKTNNNVENLEWCTPMENVHHSIETGLHGTNSHRKHKTNTSGYIGVSFHKHIKKWQARIITDIGERKSLGYFLYKIDAAIAYDEAVDKYFNGNKPKNFLASTF